MGFTLRGFGIPAQAGRLVGLLHYTTCGVFFNKRRSTGMTKEKLIKLTELLEEAGYEINGLKEMNPIDNDCWIVEIIPAPRIKSSQG